MGDHSHGMTLIEFIRELLGRDRDGVELRDWFQNDPHAALAHHGLGHLTTEDVHDAMVLVQDNDTVSFDREYDTGAGGLGPAAHHAGGHEHVREHITGDHVTNTVDNHSVTATGDGAVAAGDGIERSTITTGDGDVVGDGNQAVSGDGDTTAFGSGSAVTGVSVDDGSAFSVDGDASGDASTDGSHNRSWSEDDGHVSISGAHDQETDASVHTHVDDHSHTDVGSHDDVDLHFG